MLRHPETSGACRSFSPDYRLIFSEKWKKAEKSIKKDCFLQKTCYSNSFPSL